MKFVVSGATGMIGGTVLRHLLELPALKSVVDIYYGTGKGEDQWRRLVGFAPFGFIDAPATALGPAPLKARTLSFCAKVPR